MSGANFTNSSSGVINLNSDPSANNLETESTFTNDNNVNITGGAIICNGTCDGMNALPIELTEFYHSFENGRTYLHGQLPAKFEVNNLSMSMLTPMLILHSLRFEN